MDKYLYQDGIHVFDSALSEVELLKEFLHVSREYLMKAQDDNVVWHNNYQKMNPLKLDYDYSDGYIENYLDGLNKHGNIFPRFLYYSFLILAYTLFEAQMRQIFQVMNYFNYTELKWDKLGGNNLHKAKRLLDDINLHVSDEKVKLDKLRDYFMVRNCIVHHRGWINEFRHHNKLMDICTKYSIVSDLLGYDEPFIELTEEFCGEVGNALEMFFLELSTSYLEKRQSEK